MRPRSRASLYQHYLIVREFGEEYTREEVDRKIVRGLEQLEENEGLEGQEFCERLRQQGQDLSLLADDRISSLRPEAAQDLTGI